MVKHVDVAVFDTVKEVKDGTWRAGIRRFDLAKNGVGYVYDDKNKALIPDDVRAQVEAKRAQIVAGKIVVPFE